MWKINQNGNFCSSSVWTTTAQFTLKEWDKILKDQQVTNILGEPMISDMVEVTKDWVRQIVSASQYATSNF